MRCFTATGPASAFEGIIPLTSPLPTCTQYLEGRPNANLLNLKPRGIDASIHYTWDMEDWGAFRSAML